MSSVKRLVRLIDMTYILESKNGTKVAYLANKYQVSQKQIYRDLAILQEAGLPIYKDNGYKVLKPI